MRRDRRALGVVLSVGVAVWACDAGEVMVDAGDMLRDAGEAMSSDAEAADSATPEDGAVLEGDGAVLPPAATRVECTVARIVRQVHDETGRENTQTYWYAELRDPEIRADGSVWVRATVCDRETFDEPPPWETSVCPPGYTCSGDPSVQAPYLDCTSSTAEISDGVARAYCGYRTESEFSDGSTDVRGTVRRTAYFTIER